MSNIILFFTFMKLGAFTFGGGYGMVALVENEIIMKKNWLSRSEFLDIIAIAESTPGPMAINLATYVGYKMNGFRGAAVASIAVCIPSFVIIYVISLVFDAFKSISYVESAFKGIQVCVVYLIIMAGVRMLREMRKDAISIIVLIASIVLFIIFSLFDVPVSSIIFILVAGMVGVISYALRKLSGRELK